MALKKRYRLTFTEEILGTANSNPDIHSEYIASLAPDAESREEEVAALGVEEATKRDMTVFSRDENGQPMLWDYQIRGFLKSAAKAVGQMIPSDKLSAYKSKIDSAIVIAERKIPIHLPDEGDIGSCQRPLRAETPQGPRVALANSETCPAGSWVEITVCSLFPENIVSEELLDHWFLYGSVNGLGQWRNSGKGSFVADTISCEKLNALDIMMAREKAARQKIEGKSYTEEYSKKALKEASAN